MLWVAKKSKYSLGSQNLYSSIKNLCVSVVVRRVVNVLLGRLVVDETMQIKDRD